jgi:hypothetical protein
MMNIEKKPSARPLHVSDASRERPTSRAFGISDENPAEARVQRYLAFSRLSEVERARILAQVMSRASVSGDPGRWLLEVIRELHRALASRTQTELTVERPTVPFPGTGTVPLNAEDSISWSSRDWRAAAWTTSSRKERPVPRIFAPSGQTHFTSTPPIKRRPMAPQTIEYISLRGLRRSLLAWLLGKRAPAPLSLGRIPGK